MKTLGKVTAFVVSKDTPRKLVVFEHPMAGLQLPAGTVEPGEDAPAAAAREVFEETGLEVTSRGVVLGEEVRPLGPGRAAMLETVATDEATFQHGHKVRVLGEDEGSVQVREEIYDHNMSPPELISACYLYVTNADALYEQWRSAELAGRLHPPQDTPYGLREFAHVDPDGNLLRVGSPLEDDGDAQAS